MIALVSGTVASADEDGVVINTGGVGYLVQCHVRTLGRLTMRRDEVVLHVHTSVSDDAIRLYGFETPDELRLFRLLISVERIGPRAALAMLGASDLATLAGALRNGDIALLASVPGIGKKTAERLALELRDKVDWIVPGASAVAVSSSAEAAVTALTGLGYREVEARTTVARVTADGGPDGVTEIVQAALRYLDSVVRST